MTLIQCILSAFLKNDNYPKLRLMGFEDEHIKTLMDKYARKFQAINDFMIENGRYPLFDNPNDIYSSSLRFNELIKIITEEEIEEIFGCSFQEYAPEVYEPKKQ